MKNIFCLLFLVWVSLSVDGQTITQETSGGTIYKISLRDNLYKFDHASYAVFIPEGISEIRAVFVHQHGCAMEGHGASIAYDLQYQAFAKKWHLAIVGPDLYPKPKSSCDEWIHPIEDGSGPALLAMFDSIGCRSNHPELSEVPWLLWGHSGGGYWVLAMLKTYPERIMGAVCYSAAFDPNFNYSESVAKIPVLLRHAGGGDLNKPVNCWGTALHAFSKIRNMDGLISIAYNAGQNHNFTHLRSMVIPFFESVLEQRLAPKNGLSMNDMDQAKAWLCDTTTTGVPGIYKASTFKGNKLGMSWLPDSACAAKFSEYISTGIVKDVTPPPAPTNLKLASEKVSMKISWNADADIESGIQCFNIYKNGALCDRVPARGIFQTYSTNGDDAVPINPVPMSYRFSVKELTRKDTVTVTTVNSFNLESVKITLIR